MGVICELCGEEFGTITWSHLRYTHNITCLEYSRRFPFAPLISEENRQRKVELAEGNQYAVGSPSRTGYFNSRESKEAVGKANEAIWAGLSPKEKRTRLRNSFHNEGCGEEAAETKRKRWAALSYEERQEIVLHSFRSPEAIRRNLEAQARKDISGSNNPNWGNFWGSGTVRTYGYGWSAIAYFVKVRDGWICQKCGNREDLCVHHIDHDTDNVDDTNLITLCRICNASVNGDDRAYWEELFRDKIKEIYCAAA